jgi:hypothetical protein
MKSCLPYTVRWACSAVGLALATTLCHAQQIPPQPAGNSESFSIGLVVGWTSEHTPADFLELVGMQTKARWRQLYREPPPVPSPDRHRTAFTLGSLLSDSLLALQAADTQQFRNTNQDVLAYCRVLGLGEKISPRLMAQAKLAEQEKWDDLRQELVDGHQELTRLLRDQRDEDLAVLVDLGVWLRELEIVSLIVVDVPELRVKPLCIGSPALLNDLHERFMQMSEATRVKEDLADIGGMLDFLIRHWTDPKNDPPPQELVARTHEKMKNLLRKLTMR